MEPAPLSALARHPQSFKQEKIYISMRKSSSAIRQKGESQNGCYKKIKHVKFSEKRTFLPPIRTRACRMYVKPNIYNRVKLLQNFMAPLYG